MQKSRTVWTHTVMLAGSTVESLRCGNLRWNVRIILVATCATFVALKTFRTSNFVRKLIRLHHMRHRLSVSMNHHTEFDVTGSAVMYHLTTDEEIEMISHNEWVRKRRRRGNLPDRDLEEKRPDADQKGNSISNHTRTRVHLYIWRVIVRMKFLYLM